ncbi:uncharacterized protein [Palaemon carinicauda]|uniref:uncharacterized protein n=1 Tax=Palaemon carinicauda TaxID=392227 RepID=UPI0035B5B28E
MAEKDQRYHRFVWRFDLSSPIRHWQWLRLPFGDKPAPDIVMIAVRTLADTFKEEEPIGAQLINCRMYMDDVIESFDKSELAIAAMDQVDRILEKGSFRIKEWHSNDPSVDRCPEDKQTRVLGHVWDKVTDSLAIQLDKFREEFSKLTKRKVASLISKLWDPTGMLSPVTIRYKICLQDLWASGIGWDDELSVKQIKMWKGHIHEMNQLIGFRLDRMIKQEDSLGDPQLHGFSDASESALGSVIWLKWNTSHGVELKFVIAESLVAPLKLRSIPRLELTAAVVMARLALLVLQVVGRVSTMKFWTNSEVVLAWVRSPTRTFKPFVSARVQEIHDALPGFSKEFCYVPSQLNPADALTKLIKPKYTPESLKRIQFVGILADESFEERFTELSSDWNRLVRITAYCRRLLLQQDPENYQSHLEPKEIQEVELALFYASQKSLNNEDEVNHTQIKRLDPKLDEKGILRIGGRLQKLHFPYEQRHPVLLVRNSSLAEAFAQRIHRCTGHQGYRVAISLAFKRGVYIIGGARLFKDIAFKCCFCRTRRRLLLGQQMGELPSFRDAFLYAWRRFTCNHGIHPVLAVSDRGRNFIGVQEKLQKWINSWNESLIKDKFAIAGTKFEWKFNRPHASHMNSDFESLIRSCRRGLDAVADYHHKKSSALEWQTILSEVRYLVNSRPLFPNGPDPLESPTITSNDLLFPHGQPSVLQPYIGNEVNLRSIVDVAQQRIQIFWETWIRYMPPQLVHRSKWFHPKQNLQVGDLVLLLEPGLKGDVAPRGLWRRSLVNRIHPGKDGLVRRVTVRTVENGKRFFDTTDVSARLPTLHSITVVGPLGVKSITEIMVHMFSLYKHIPVLLQLLYGPAVKLICKIRYDWNLESKSSSAAPQVVLGLLACKCVTTIKMPTSDCLSNGVKYTMCHLMDFATQQSHEVRARTTPRKLQTLAFAYFTTHSLNLLLLHFLGPTSAEHKDPSLFSIQATVNYIR